MVAVRFEVRLAEDSPVAGFVPVQLPTGQTVCLHQTPLVSNADIAATQVVCVLGTSAFDVEVRFNAEGAEKMVRGTRGHVGKPIAISSTERSSTCLCCAVRFATRRASPLTSPASRRNGSRTA